MLIHINRVTSMMAKKQLSAVVAATLRTSGGKPSHHVCQRRKEGEGEARSALPERPMRLTEMLTCTLCKKLSFGGDSEGTSTTGGKGGGLVL
jgi:hypothetical protein